MMLWRLELVTGGIATAAIAALALGVVLSLPQAAAEAAGALAEPDAAHWLGTDAAGRDVFATSMQATLTSMLPALLGAAGAALTGVPVGAVLPKVARQPVSALALVVPAFALGVLMAGAAIHGLAAAILAIAIPGLVFAALSTQVALATLLETDYLASARVAGLSRFASLERHILPRLVPAIAAIGLELVAAGIAIDAILSFAGLGGAGGLGAMIAAGLPSVQARPLLVLAPGLLAIALIVALRLAASGLRASSHGAA